MLEISHVSRISFFFWTSDFVYLKCPVYRYNEKYPDNPQYSKDGFNHFTQVVWTASKRLCMATAMSVDGEWYTVGRYAPAGNVQGQRGDNVPDLPPSG